MITPKLAIAGGGTGGHIAPALALAEEFIARFGPGSVHFLCGGNELERGMLSHAGHYFTTLPISRPTGTLRSKATTVITTAMAVPAARRALKNFNATMLACVGGYASLPGAMAASLLRLPVFLLESNAVPGKVTRHVSRFAKVCYAHMPMTRSLDCPVEVRGNPVRASFLDTVDKAAARRALGLDPRVPTLLVIGGSQGAGALNDAILSAAPTLKSLPGGIQVLHLTGPDDLERANWAYREAGISGRTAAFTHNTATWMAASDVALTRSGAGTISELLTLGVPGLYVPYPHAADDHQLANARWVASNGAGVVLAQDALDAPRLREALLHLLPGSDQREPAVKAALALSRPFACGDILDAMLAQMGFSDGLDSADQNHRAAA